MDNHSRDEDIAVIGLSGRFPGASSIDAFWKNSCLGLDSVSRFSTQQLEKHVKPTLLHHPEYVRAKGILENVDLFDAEFFGLSELDAKLLDPQHRLFLLSAWEALEDAGYAPRQCAERVGVFASTGMSLYLLNNLLKQDNGLQAWDEYQVLLANDKDFLATRVSYLLNLKGPSITLQTGCSSSLVCIHYAIQSLLNGESDIALAGGVSITIPEEQGYLYRKGMIGSSDGRCRAFDKEAEGTVKSNGVGVVVLKPLKDALADGNTIYAVVRGSAINNDGAQKVGYTAPSVRQQAAVIQEALNIAEVEPSSIDYIETHGTGTILGDPIEVSALKQAFGPSLTPNSCALVSLKTNLGHLDVAAGVASFIRACLAIYHQKMPASLHFSMLNPKINLEDSPFFINTSLKNWPKTSHPRRAGVSAFGVGGTNVHVILQEAPVIPVMEPTVYPSLSVFSARTPEALKRTIQRLIDYGEKHPDVDLQEVAYTLFVGREALPFRTFVVATTLPEWVAALRSMNIDDIQPAYESPYLVFMFSGQGAQYVGMGRALYETDQSFRTAFDEVLRAFAPHLSYDLRALMHPLDETPEASHQLSQTCVAQPALFALEYALAQSYLAKGLKPSALIGHSIGEYAAAVLAGIFSLEDAARLIVLRGQLVQQLPAGQMLAVQKEASSLTELRDVVDIALENSPMNTVISGNTDAILTAQDFLRARQLRYHVLHTSHAFHSRMLDPILEEFRQHVSRCLRHAPRVPLISNVTGTWLTAAEACSVEYWVQQLRQTVKFSQGLSKLQQQPACVFLEIGPGRTLQSLAQQHGIKAVVNSLRHPLDEQHDASQQCKTLGYLWQKGVMIAKPERTRRIPLPTYSWDLKRYWVDAEPVIFSTPHATNVVGDITELVSSAWKNTLGVEPKSASDHFFNQGGHSLSAISFIEQLPSHIKAFVQVTHVYQYPTYGQFLQFVNGFQRSEKEEMMDAESDLFLEGVEL